MHESQIFVWNFVCPSQAWFDLHLSRATLMGYWLRKTASRERGKRSRVVENNRLRSSSFTNSISMFSANAISKPHIHQTQHKWKIRSIYLFYSFQLCIDLFLFFHHDIALSQYVYLPLSYDVCCEAHTTKWIQCFDVLSGHLAVTIHVYRYLHARSFHDPYKYIFCLLYCHSFARFCCIGSEMSYTYFSRIL